MIIRALVRVVLLKNMQTLQDLIGRAVVMPGSLSANFDKHDKKHQVSKAPCRKTIGSYIIEINHFIVQLSQPFLACLNAHDILHARSNTTVLAFPLGC